MTPSERIQAIAQALDISIFELATKAGVSPSLLIIRGDKEPNPTIRNISRICSAFPEINTEFLIRGEFPILRRPVAAIVDGYPDSIDDDSASFMAAETPIEPSNGDDSALRQIIKTQQITISSLQELVAIQRQQLDNK